MSIRFRALAGALFGLLAPAPAHATDEDTQLWVMITATVPLAPGLNSTFEISPRIRAGADQLVTRAALDLQLAEGLTAGAALAYVELAGGHELRPHQQIIYTTGPLALRTRLEERFFAGADRAQLRLRQQARLSFPVDDKTQISAAGEFLYIVQNQVRGTDVPRDQWRAEVAVRRRLSANFDASLGYRVILTPREALEDRLSHVPLITLAWRP
jgi:hypothetical protein